MAPTSSSSLPWAVPELSPGTSSDVPGPPTLLGEGECARAWGHLLFQGPGSELTSSCLQGLSVTGRLFLQHSAPWRLYHRPLLNSRLQSLLGLESGAKRAGVLPASPPPSLLSELISTEAVHTLCGGRSPLAGLHALAPVLSGLSLLPLAH